MALLCGIFSLPFELRIHATEPLEIYLKPLISVNEKETGTN